MLILRRKEGQWVELTHRSGDTVRIRVYNIRSRYPGQLDLAFDDPDHFFTIQRPERGTRTGDEAGASSPDSCREALPTTVDAGPFSANTSAAPA